MPGPTIRFILVDGDTSIHRQLHEQLAQTDDIRLIAETRNEGQTFALIAQHQPDVVVIAAQSPSSQQVELVRQLRASGLAVGILVLLLSEDVLAIKALIDAGANGYTLQSSPMEEIIEAIRAVQEANQVLVQITRCTWNDHSAPIAHHKLS